MPEFTRPTSMTVTAEEDWIVAVIAMPSSRALSGLSVILRRIFSSLPPAIFSRPFDIVCIPKRKNARPPNRVNILNIVISYPPNNEIKAVLFQNYSL